MNGRERSAEIRYVCTDDPHSPSIQSVIEVEVCSYQIEVATPLACTVEVEEAVLQRVKQLGVFGYADNPSELSKDSSSSSSNSVQGLKRRIHSTEPRDYQKKIQEL